MENRRIEQLLQTFKHIELILIKNGFTKKQIAISLGLIRNKKAATDRLNKIERGENISLERLEKYVYALENDRSFQPILQPILQPEIIDVRDSTDIYMLYFWSAKMHIGIAAVSLVKDDKDIIDYERSELVYLHTNQLGKFEVNKKRKIESYTIVPNKVIEIIYQKKPGSPRTFITVDVSGGDINDVNFAYFSYCGSMSTNKGPYAGIGIIEKIGKENFNQRLKEVSMKIPSSIINALYQRRHNVEHSEIGLYESPDEIRDKQRTALKSLHGFWVGYYPRSLKDSDNEIGCLAKVIAFISDSGEVLIHYKTPNDQSELRPDYTGIIRFPYSKSTSVIVGKLEFYKGTHRIRLLLKIKSNKLVGNMTGWRDKDGFIFSRAIYFEPIPNITRNYKENVNDILKQYNPRGYGYDEIFNFLPEIKYLKKLEEEYLHTVDNCIIGTAKYKTKQLDIFFDDPK